MVQAGVRWTVQFLVQGRRKIRNPVQVLSVVGGNGQGTAHSMIMWQTGQQAHVMKGSHGIEHPVHVLPVVEAMISMTARHWRGSKGEGPFREQGRMELKMSHTS
eukprot:CAMPEP_0206145170 /NCGR_PEP_ID=MMETSP1473-20131121/26563_1 /ASSEMBLY_ACC=CAM_ASM_001109 /TAXON_ID=1461547 /ORGANISM="Stichococcus sp, Strain RCC1054" /LENGTH=103 /DNA_ID=CAMNT_0053541269 /DNA_START=246 /DNA_END=557 /DNA_ORIENTATION=-